MWLKLLQKNLHTHLHCSTIYNSQTMETVKFPHYWWVDQKNVVFIQNGIFSATKKNEILSFTSKWMELENIMLSEISQAQKAKNYMFSLTCRI
jgi:sulfur transfer complex TusBCD TusB component (DsrH family)